MHAATEGLNSEGQGRKRRKESNRNVGISRERRKKSGKTVKLDFETKTSHSTLSVSAAFVRHCMLCWQFRCRPLPPPPSTPVAVKACSVLVREREKRGEMVARSICGPKSLLLFFVYVQRCERPRREYYEGEASPAAAVFYPPTPNRTQHHKPPPPPFPPPLLSPM